MGRRSLWFILLAMTTLSQGSTLLSNIADDDKSNPDLIADDLKPKPDDEGKTLEPRNIADGTKTTTVGETSGPATHPGTISSTNKATTTNAKNEETPPIDTVEKDRRRPKIIIVRKPVPVTVEPGVIWGLEWWELICIIFGSILLLLFVCACCCAIIESGNIQRQEVRGPNGERLGFLQAPGRHIVLVMDSRMSRFRGNNIVTTTTPNQTAALGTTGQGIAPQSPPHAPPVQPLYPKV